LNVKQIAVLFLRALKYQLKDSDEVKYVERKLGCISRKLKDEFEK